MDKNTKKYMGLQQQRIGHLFETYIQNQFNTDYLVRGIAEAYKEEEIRIANSYKLKKKLRVDFTGWTKVFDKEIFEIAKPLGIECKSCKERFQNSSLKEHQVEYLLRLNKVGGIALILIEFRNTSKIVRLNLNKINIAELRTNKKTYTFNQILPYSDLTLQLINLDFLNSNNIYLNKNNYNKEYQLF